MQSQQVATVLTVYGIETKISYAAMLKAADKVATVLTVYGIETVIISHDIGRYTCRLQQYLPFTVLKRDSSSVTMLIRSAQVATVLTVYGIET